MLAHVLLQAIHALLPLVIAKCGCNNIHISGVTGMGRSRLLAAVPCGIPVRRNWCAFCAHVFG